VKGGAQYPVRLHYAKRGKVRWISNRDVARAFERAFRIAALPLAFTEGFSPRPKVSFGLALSTGYESDAEYLDVEFASEVDLDRLPATVTDALPIGIDIVDAVALVDRAPALMDAVTSVEWCVVVSDDDGTPVDPARLQAAIDDALALPTLPVARRRKGRDVVEDVKPVITRIDVHEGDAASGALGVVCAMELRTQPRGAKPGDVLAAIASAAAVPCGLAEAHVLRTHQWIERDGARHEPLGTDTRPRPGASPVRDWNKGLPDVERRTDAGVLAGVASGASRAGRSAGELDGAILERDAQ
jgi:radical SAM-linked protein